MHSVNVSNEQVLKALSKKHFQNAKSDDRETEKNSGKNDLLPFVFCSCGDPATYVTSPPSFSTLIRILGTLIIVNF